jgi:bifunctional DNA-binding transcriptional regulator/antitoxin component of YhaV-PrlF toxin-antitoxin module
MERRLIRKKWQITIPKGIRRSMGLYQGQTLNWQIVEGFNGGPAEIRLFTGSYALRQEASGFHEDLAATPPSKRRALRRQIGISDTFISGKGRDKLRAIIMEVILDLGLVKKGGKGTLGDPPGPGDPELN